MPALGRERRNLERDGRDHCDIHREAVALSGSRLKAQRHVAFEYKQDRSHALGIHPGIVTNRGRLTPQPILCGL